MKEPLTIRSADRTMVHIAPARGFMRRWTEAITGLGKPRDIETLCGSTGRIYKLYREKVTCLACLALWEDK